MVELGLIAPVLLLLLSLTVDFGRVFSMWVVLQNAAREGAYVASFNFSDSTLRVMDPTITAAVVREGGSVGVQSNEVTISYPGTGDVVDVVVTHPFQVITPLIGAVLGNSIAITGRADFPVRVKSPLPPTVVPSTATPTSVPTLTPTPTPAPAPTVLVGDSRVEGNQDNSNQGQALAFQFQALATGNSKTTYLYLDSQNQARTVAIGLYSDQGGHPSTLLGQTTLNGASSGWNSVAFPSIGIVRGTIYWLAILGVDGQLEFRTGSGSGSGGAENSAQESLRSLPNTWTTLDTGMNPNVSGYLSS